MAVVDPYAPCPCGSGQKFKWCCQKVEAFAERAQRLYDNGQVDAALKALDEGLGKNPSNAWLLVRTAGAPQGAAPLIEAAVAAENADLAASGFRTMEEALALTLGSERLLAGLARIA